MTGSPVRPFHLVSAVVTTIRLVPRQMGVPDKAHKLAAIPALFDRLGGYNGLRGALVSIDAFAGNARSQLPPLWLAPIYLLVEKAALTQM